MSKVLPVIEGLMVNKDRKVSQEVRDPVVRLVNGAQLANQDQLVHRAIVEVQVLLVNKVFKVTVDPEDH